LVCGTLADLDGIWIQTHVFDDTKTGNSTEKKTYFFLKRTLHFFSVLQERLPSFMRNLQSSLIVSLVVEKRGPCFFLLNWYYFSDL
jgi:hypothetical protein